MNITARLTGKQFNGYLRLRLPHELDDAVDQVVAAYRSATPAVRQAIVSDMKPLSERLEFTIGDVAGLASAPLSHLTHPRRVGYSRSMQTPAPSLVVRRRVCKRITAFAVAGSWGTLGYGLLFSTPNEQAWDDLEAGGRFAANILVYWPYFALTLPITATVLIMLLRRPDWLSPLWASIGVIALFGGWVRSLDYLLAAQPRLSGCAAWCLIIDAGAVAPLIGAQVSRARSNEGPLRPRRLLLHGKSDE